MQSRRKFLKIKGFNSNYN
ncbi:uncharacterized protein FFC1_07785 [Fusarium fujikuroi]|nr:uncharacterized protein FFC1_07785 [Fusarium fujikuroi]